jgi:hypothetical protein
MARQTRANPTPTDAAWDLATIRRAIQLLGAHQSRSGDAQSIARAVRYIWDFLQRRGVSAEIFQLPGLMPLIIAGNGPVMVVSHIDSLNMSEFQAEPGPPEIRNDIAHGPGVVRKAGVLAAAGSLLCDAAACPITLVIEADRHQGSRAVEAWLSEVKPLVQAAVVESVDLPVDAPAIYRGAAGLLVATIELPASAPLSLEVYRSVLPDIGHQLAEILSALKSRDAEVMLPSFYDGVEPPEQSEMDTLRSVATTVGARLASTPDAEDLLPAAHLTLGMFATPSLTIREMHFSVLADHGGIGASATIEVRLMPGQSIDAAEASLRSFVAERTPHATITVVLRRPAARGVDALIIPEEVGATRLPVAPGNSPAGLIEARGIATLGFQTISPGTDPTSEQSSLADILNGAEFIRRIASYISQVGLQAAST